MAFIRKNVNFMLVFLLIVIVSVLIGFTTYYQTTYRNLSSEYNNRVAELENARDDAATQKESLAQTQSELELRVADKNKFETLYTELVAEKNKVDKDLVTTRGQLASAQASLQQANDDLKQAQQDLLDSLQELEAKNQALESVTAQRYAFCVELSQYNSSVSC